MNQKINDINKIKQLENKLPFSNKNSNLKNGRRENKIILILSPKNQKEVENKNESLKKEQNLIQTLRPNFKSVIINKNAKINKVKNIDPDDFRTKIKQIINGKKMKNEKIVLKIKKKSIQKEKKNEEKSPVIKNIINRKDIFFKNGAKLGNNKKVIISKFISKNKELSITKKVSNENKDNIKNKENKEFKNNKENKNNIEGKKEEKPEDISDYINIDEKDYNNNYTDLNGKITNEAIEEVEEAKEVSEMRQSSEFCSNISNSKSSNKSSKMLSIKDIGNQKYGKERIINKFNRCLTSKNKGKLNNIKKVFSKKNNSFGINMPNSNDSL